MNSWKSGEVGRVGCAASYRNTANLIGRGAVRGLVLEERADCGRFKL